MGKINFESADARGRPELREQLHALLGWIKFAFNEADILLLAKGPNVELVAGDMDLQEAQRLVDHSQATIAKDTANLN